MLNKELLEILCCPKDHGDLDYNQEKDILVCKVCSRVYEIKDDIPIMLIEDENNG
jgi:uncharacterized protein YbaR (Trm112 family)